MIEMGLLERVFWSFVAIWPLLIFLIGFALAGIVEYFRPDLFECNDDDDCYDDEKDGY